MKIINFNNKIKIPIIKITLMDRQVNLNLRNLFPLHNITITHIFLAVKHINN